jgi:hypothetical protein
LTRSAPLLSISSLKNRFQQGTPRPSIPAHTPDPVIAHRLLPS